MLACFATTALAASCVFPQIVALSTYCGNRTLAHADFHALEELDLASSDVHDADHDDAIGSLIPIGLMEHPTQAGAPASGPRPSGSSTQGRSGAASFSGIQDSQTSLAGRPSMVFTITPPFSLISRSVITPSEAGADAMGRSGRWPAGGSPAPETNADAMSAVGQQRSITTPDVPVSSGSPPPER